MQYELTGKEREGRGPIVVLVDDSDSMDGSPSTFAKAAALALADLALADRRACRLILFSDRLKGSCDFRPGRDSTSALLSFLSQPVDGGTDGEAELPKAFLDDWKRRASVDGLTTYAVHIGATAPPVLHALTSDVIEMRTLLPDALGDALFARITPS